MSPLAGAAAVFLLVASPGANSVGPAVNKNQPDTVTSKQSPDEASSKQPDSVWLAAHGGFLLGNAQRCGVEGARVSRASQLVQQLITATATDEHEEENANTRFAAFFLATVSPKKEDTKLVPQCKTVVSEFKRLEGHMLAAKDSAQMAGDAPVHFRLRDGE